MTGSIEIISLSVPQAGHSKTFPGVLSFGRLIGVSHWGQTAFWESLFGAVSIFDYN